MTEAVLFTVHNSDGIWRLLVTQYAGQYRADWRKWYLDSEGALKPTRQGCPIPLDSIAEMHRALGDYLASQARGGLKAVG